MNSDASYAFALFDTEAMVSSGWVRLGSIFRGYTVAGYDAEREVIHLRNGSAEIDVKLRSTQVQKEPALDLAKLTNSELLSLGFYRVKPGDTALRIAHAENLVISQLLALNPEVQFRHLQVGQILVMAAGPVDGPSSSNP